MASALLAAASSADSGNVAAGLTWQQLCCFNGLESCGPVPASTPLVLPCAGEGSAEPAESLPGDCAAAGEAMAAASARTSAGCACSGDYSAGLGGRTYRLSGACAPSGSSSRSNGGVDNPWCEVEQGSCPDGAAPPGGADACSSSAEGGGCDLLPGLSVVPAAGAALGDGTRAEGPGVCCALCGAAADCAGFTYTPGGGCFLSGSVAGVEPLPGAVSGISRGAPGAPVNARRRRRRLQEGGGALPEGCPSVLPLQKGERVDELPASLLGGATWQEVCCFNGLESCGAQEGSDGEPLALVVPCVGAASGGCTAASNNTIYVYGAWGSLCVAGIG